MGDIIFRDDLQFIHEIIGPQLRQSKQVKISISKSITINIDYCIISGNHHPENEVFLAIPGFGSGWTGMAKFGYELAALENEVCMVSMPGYGNSDDPPLGYTIDKIRRDDVDILANFIKRALPNKKIHLIGHSMSAEIITMLASRYPDLVTSISLLTPAGFERRGLLEVGIRFVLNGILHSIAFRGNRIWAELKKFLPKERNPFALSRLRQRINEWVKLCHGDESLEAFRNIHGRIPIVCVWGTKDFVFPRKKSSLSKSMTHPMTHPTFSLPLWHNVTMKGSDLTALTVNFFVRFFVE